MNARLRYLGSTQEACAAGVTTPADGVVTCNDAFTSAAHDLSTIYALLEAGEDRTAPLVGVGRGRSDIKTGSTAI
jgi:hypothetical protein